MSGIEARRAHVVGAGLAGLSAAMTMVEQGYAVTLSEAGRQAGGRCRSYRDPQLGLVIDNGNHLLLSGNARAMAYLDRIGARDRLIGPGSATFDFADLRDGRQWRLRINEGRVPWWWAVPGRRVPGTRFRDYPPLVRLLTARPEARIADRLPTDGALWERLLEPFFVAALNTDARDGSARLAGAIVSGTLAKGGHACHPLIAQPTLSAAFVEPALAWLAVHGVICRTGRRLRAIETGKGGVARLLFTDGADEIAPGDCVILAVPAWIAAELLPGLTVPDRHHAIVNAHFACPPPAGTPLVTGLIGGTAEWLFAFPDRLSTTTSAADVLCDEDREVLAARIWRDVSGTLGFSGPMPPWQIVRERRATFSATPAQDAKRPPATTTLANLFLAGDWTQTGLPSTIEGAILSGEAAAALAHSHSQPQHRSC